MTVVPMLLTYTALLSCPLSSPPSPSLPRSAGTGQGPWQWPLEPPPRVVRAFDPPARPWAPGHRGVDLAARAGQPVYAAGAGRVSYATRLAGRGVVSISHISHGRSHGRLRTTYLPVRPSVRPGQPVRAGDRIGVVEPWPGHCGSRPCLHWGLRHDLAYPTYVDPLSLLARAQVRLLPIWTTAPPPGSGPHSDWAPAPGESPPENPVAGPYTNTNRRQRKPPGPLERTPDPPPATAPAVIAGTTIAITLSLTLPHPRRRKA